MNAIATQEAQSMGLITAVLQSEHTPTLFGGVDTHDPALRLTAQLVRYTEDDDLIMQIVVAALPPDYKGNTYAELPKMIESARENGFDAGGGEPSAVEIAVRIMKNAGVTLFRDMRDRPFMGVPVSGGGVLNYELGSKLAKAVVIGLYYRDRGKPLSSGTLKEAMNALQSEALIDGEKHEVFLRIGGRPGLVYVDLGHDDGLVVEISRDGWQTTHDCPIKFERRPGFGAMPVPVEGGSFRPLQTLLGLDETNFCLVMAFLLNCLRPGPTFMCAFVEGEQGSGKSFLCEIIKRIVDPSVPLRMRLPKDDRDLMIKGSHYHVLVFDNASSVNGDMSDALCSLATGGGLATRELYSNDDLTVFTLSRPFIINGIGEFVHRPDLMERAIPIKLPTITPEGRKTEEQLRDDFETLLPGLLGTLYDIVAAGLRNFESVAPPRMIRMADVAKWLEACEPGTEFPAGTLLPLLEQAQTDMVVDKIADLPLVMLLRKHLEHGPIEDTIGEIYIVLLLEKPKGDRTFPGSSSHLSKALKQLKPALAKADIFLEIGPHRREGRLIKIWRKDQEDEAPRRLRPY
jgi:hypothetical protein